MALALLATAALWGCPRPSSRVGPAQPATADADHEPLALVPAERCGECHGKMEREWRHSAHARADSSPLYRAMRADPKAVDCDRCHAPLRQISPADTTAAQGVTCEVCHTFASIQLGREGGGGFVLHPEESVRYGPLCDAQQHYFHTMGCSPLHQDGMFCAACHDLHIAVPGGGTLAIYPEYREWHDESLATDGRSCQQCHMPSERAEVAVGSATRDHVRGHGFVLGGALLGQALSGRATIAGSAGKLQVAVSLTNSGAGHAIPSGLPGRQLVIAVEAIDKSGQVLARQEHTYGRVLVDAEDREVPYYAAVRQRADTRVHVGETREDAFSLAAPSAVSLRVRVTWRPIAAPLAKKLGIPMLADEPMLAASLPLSALPAGGAAVLPLMP